MSVEGGLVYVEYMSRMPGVDVHEADAALNQAQEAWAAAHPEDVLLWSAARTWRLGPEPEIVGIWYTPGAGLDRIDAWDRIFRSGVADHHERPARQVSRIDVAGCYRALRDPVPARGGIYYAEYFRPTGTPGAIRQLYERRLERLPAFALNLLACRIGQLAPEPGGLAVWTIPDFASLAAIATQLDGVREPVEPCAAATYHDVGQEIL
jgi:hypothetical protein